MTGPPDVEGVKDALWSTPAQLTSYVVATSSHGVMRISDIAQDALAVIEALQDQIKQVNLAYGYGTYLTERDAEISTLRSRIADLEGAARTYLDVPPELKGEARRDLENTLAGGGSTR